MASRRPVSRLASFALVFFASFTLLQAQDRPANPKDADGPPRPRLYLATDKPMYRPGETAWFRGVLLDAFRYTPLANGVQFRVAVKSPKGDKVFETASILQGGAGGVSWPIPQETSGGEYTLAADFPGYGYAPAEIKFDVRSYRAPRLRTDLQFARKGYGPGEEVTASLTATRAEGGIPAGAGVTAVARLDGAEIHRSALKLDEKGACSVTFTLPAEMSDGDGSLALVIQDGGVQETAARTLPIVLNKVALELFPEGGDLIAGLENRVYFEARDTRQKPADVSGRVIDEQGANVATFAAAHEGRGSLHFTPAAGRKYFVALDKPAGNTQRFALPAAQESGYVMHSIGDSYAAGAPVRIAVAGTAPGRVRVALYKLDREIAQSSAVLTGPGGVVEFHLAAPVEIAGVLRATLFDAEDKPRAERLVYRAPDRTVKIAIAATPARAVPGAEVTLTITTTDASGKPVPACVGLTATDDAVLEQIEKRERAPRLPVQALLGSDVRELMDAQVYLSSAPGAPAAIDLLLGTQGWRRFAYADVNAFVEKSGDAARRALALVTPPPPAPGAVAFGGKGEIRDRGVKLAAVAEDMEKNEAQGFEEEARKPRAGAKEDDAKRPAAKAEEKEMAHKNKDIAAGAAPAERAQAADQLEMDEEVQNRAGEGGGAGAGFAGRMRKKAQMAVVRVFAHKAQPNRAPDQRNDFAETVYWNAGVTTDANGKAVVSFDLSDSVTSFRVRADGFTSDGALGESDVLIESRKPFYLEPKLPLEVTAGDLIEVPVALANGTDAEILAHLKTTIGAGITREGNEPELKLAHDSSGRLFLTLIAGQFRGNVEVRLEGSAGPFSDTVIRAIPVVPAGFPIEMAFGGKLATLAAHSVTIPAGVEPSSIITQAVVYPSPLATITEALAGLLREPGGCFEQTSSAAYPNIMVLNYLKSHHVDNATLVARAGDLVERGYKRLAGFECKERGYEWFGGDPGHEALTAYGVMEFNDMKGVIAVDPAMLERTRTWLNGRRDGKGGFARNARALDSFGGAPDDITNAYIVWALQQAGEKDLAKEVAGVKERALASNDAYLLALSANVLLTAKDEGAYAILDKLTGHQDKDGAVRGAATSITRSGGQCLEVETTSLAVLAWLQATGHEAMCDKGSRWLFEQCQGGRFGATQSTILALKAILGYDAAHAAPKVAGKVALRIDGQVVKEIAFTPESTGTLDLGDFAAKLTPGTHAVELAMEGGAEMPYALDVRYSAEKPANGDQCKTWLKTTLSSAQVREGETIDLAVEWRNTTQEGLPMTIAIVGLPGGLEPRHDQLKELVKSGAVDFYEVRGREVVLYKRCMKPAEQVKLSLSLLAAVPGKYKGPASRAYLYYTDDQKQWTDPLAVTVVRAGE